MWIGLHDPQKVNSDVAHRGPQRPCGKARELAPLWNWPPGPLAGGTQSGAYTCLQLRGAKASRSGSSSK